MTKRISAVLALAVVACAITATTAGASDWTSSTMDQIASEVAGKPVHVYCENDPRPWNDFAMQNLGIPGQWLDGFTQFANPVVYISPHQCERLHFAIDIGYQDAGLAYTASSLFTLAHESVHQRGVTDEGLTDCAAMPLVAPLAIKYLHVPESIQVPRTMSYSKSIRVKQTTRIVQMTKVVYDTVPNPEVDRINQWVLAWHHARPAEYQGTC